MKIPTDVIGFHKIRDAKILSLYATDEWSFADIGKKFNITATRVGQIIYKNRHLLKIDRDYENFKQVTRIKKHIKKVPDSKKDPHDWESLLDGKINTKHSENKTSGETNIYIVRASGDKIAIQTTDTGTSTISRSLSI